jgi:hypothetical protein
MSESILKQYQTSASADDENLHIARFTTFACKGGGYRSVPNCCETEENEVNLKTDRSEIPDMT